MEKKAINVKTKERERERESEKERYNVYSWVSRKFYKSQTPIFILVLKQQKNPVANLIAHLSIKEFFKVLKTDPSLFLTFKIHLLKNVFVS